MQWDVQALHDRRLMWRQPDVKTRYSVRGVVTIANTLVDHTGKRLADVGWCWDHADERDVITHDYILSNDGCPSGIHSPIEWRRFQKRDACPAKECKGLTTIGEACRAMQAEPWSKSSTGLRTNILCINGQFPKFRLSSFIHDITGQRHFVKVQLTHEVGKPYSASGRHHFCGAIYGELEILLPAILELEKPINSTRIYDIKNVLSAAL